MHTAMFGLIVTGSECSNLTEVLCPSEVILSEYRKDHHIKSMGWEAVMNAAETK